MRALSRRYWYEPKSPLDIDSGMRNLTRCMDETQGKIMINIQTTAAYDETGFQGWGWSLQHDGPDFLRRLVNTMPEQNAT